MTHEQEARKLAENSPMADLLPCPFCGKAMRYRAALWPAEGDNDGIQHADATDCPLGEFSTWTADGSVIEAWNRRSPPATSSAVKALREAAEEFCRRVEAGEIRSKQSYSAFKSALAALAPVQQAGVEPEDGNG